MQKTYTEEFDMPFLGTLEVIEIPISYKKIGRVKAVLIHYLGGLFNWGLNMVLILASIWLIGTYFGMPYEFMQEFGVFHVLALWFIISYLREGNVVKVSIGVGK